MKQCTVCGVFKELKDFSKCSKAKDGLRFECKACGAINGAKRYRANRDRILAQKKVERDTNPEKYRERAKEAYYKDRLKSIWMTRRWQKNHPERVKESLLNWKRNNPERVKEHERKNTKKRYSTPRGKLNRKMGASIAATIRQGTKANRHWEGLVGFTADQLKKHLERRFVGGMSWENYGPVWHIDHIIPIKAFNFEVPEDLDFKRCWSLRNLQPLWARDNIKKSDKVERPFQPSLCL